MREILFRGKRTDNREWFEGCLATFKDGDCAIFDPDDERTPLYQVDPETVGQYTGLTDKNGEKIFEGDILKITDTINGIEFTAFVEFGNPNGKYDWGYQLVKVSGDDIDTDILLWCCVEDVGVYAEIVGNIYDTPELVAKSATTT